MQISGRESGVGGFPIFKADNYDSRDSRSVPDSSLILIIVSATIPASVIVLKVEAPGCKIDLPILSKMVASIILRDAFFLHNL